MACRQNGLHRCDGEGSDAHHLLNGGRRRGHEFTIALCPWHHRGVPPEGTAGCIGAALVFGPSLALSSREFHIFYGSDDELLETQNRLIEATA